MTGAPGAADQLRGVPDQLAAVGSAARAVEASAVAEEIAETARWGPLRRRPRPRRPALVGAKAMTVDLQFRAVGRHGDRYPAWVGDARGYSGVYVIRDLVTGRILYAESRTVAGCWRP